jgi:hypothetical protein
MAEEATRLGGASVPHELLRGGLTMRKFVMAALLGLAALGTGLMTPSDSKADHRYGYGRSYYSYGRSYYGYSRYNYGRSYYGYSYYRPYYRSYSYYPRSYYYGYRSYYPSYYYRSYDYCWDW